jgi:glycosyltransferase involved in cell wall biosynthesis
MIAAPASPKERARQEKAPADAVDLVVPVFNEIEMLPAFLARIESLPLALRVILVDNGSSDGTPELLRARSDVTLIEHGENLGYGRSLVDGMMFSTAPRVVLIDADCEYPPEAIPLLLEKLDSCPVVYASRFRNNPELDMSPLRKWGNRVLTALFNLMFRQRITDLYTGMKAFRREAFDGMILTRSGFEHVVELACALARRGCLIAEVPVRYTPRQTGRSKMSHVPEVLKALRLLLVHRVQPHV